MMISAPSSSFHHDPLQKTESLSPVRRNEDHLREPIYHMNKNTRRSSSVKRPMNAFLLWARGERKRVSSDSYGVCQTSLSKLLGETWRHMSIEEKQPFLDMAETLKRQYHIDHPDYQFKPKQRSSIANRTIVKKKLLSPPLHEISIMNSSSYNSSSSSTFTQEQQQVLSSTYTTDVASHIVQSSVLVLCQAIAPPGLHSSSSTFYDSNDWFLKLIEQPQAVIVTPPSRTQTASVSTRRAVRIQIINKHDNIASSPSTLLPMTPSPLSSSPIVLDETSPTLIDYLTNTNSMFNMPDRQHELIPLIDNATAYDILHDPSITTFMDLDHPNDHSGWIDTPLSTFGSNSTDIISTSPYSSYDFLSL